MEILKQLATCNILVNKKLFDTVNDTIKLLPIEKQEAHNVSSFLSLQLTILHMVDAESIC